MITDRLTQALFLFYKKTRHPEMLNYKLYKAVPNERTPELLTIYSSDKYSEVVDHLLYIQEKNPDQCYYIYNQVWNKIITVEEVIKVHDATRA